MRSKIQSIAMPCAIILGIIFHKWTAMLSPIMAVLISIMLFLAYCRVDFKELKVVKMHWIFIIIQYVGGIIILFAFKDLNIYLAGAAMILFVTPVGASAMVVGNVLGGNLNSITSYNILSNIFTSLLCPIYFTILNKFFHNTTDKFDMLHSILEIAKHVFLLMLAPLIIALILWKFWPKIQKKIGEWTMISFYIWVVAALAAFGKTFEIVKQYDYLYKQEIIIFAVALVSCFLLFFLGSLIGQKFNESTTGSLSFGQKNTILTIWMSHTFLTNPIFTIVAGAYMVFQNSFNSFQIYRSKKAKSTLVSNNKQINPSQKQSKEKTTNENDIIINIDINGEKPIQKK